MSTKEMSRGVRFEDLLLEMWEWIATRVAWNTARHLVRLVREKLRREPQLPTPAFVVSTIDRGRLHFELTDSDSGAETQ